MSLRANEQAAQRDSRSSVTQFIQGIAMKDVELVTRVEDNEFAGSGNAKQTAIHPHRRAKVISADAFLVADDAGRALQASQNPGVAP